MKANNSLEVLEKKLKYTFNNKGLLQEALIHSSYAHENNLKVSNERLELLGDAVIHLVITDFIIHKYSDQNEGELSILRSFCENENFLHERAKDLDLGDFIRFGKGELLGGGKDKTSLLSNTYEAVIAAVYLDSSYKKTTNVVLSHFKEHIENAYDNQLYLDIKSELQKMTQREFNKLPEYTVYSEEGADHEKTFYVKVEVTSDDSDRYCAEGSGLNKKSAEKDAATKLYKILNGKIKKDK